MIADVIVAFQASCCFQQMSHGAERTTRPVHLAQMDFLVMFINFVNELANNPSGVVERSFRYLPVRRWPLLLVLLLDVCYDDEQANKYLDLVVSLYRRQHEAWNTTTSDDNLLIWMLNFAFLEAERCSAFRPPSPSYVCCHIYKAFTRSKYHVRFQELLDKQLFELNESTSAVVAFNIRHLNVHDGPNSSYGLAQIE